MREAIIAMDDDRSGKLSFAEFSRACVKNGFDSEHLKLIFQCIDIDGAGTISSDEVADTSLRTLFGILKLIVFHVPLWCTPDFDLCGMNTGTVCEKMF